MRRSLKLILTLMMFSICSPAWGQEWREEAALTPIFEQAGVTGTFVLYDPVENVFRGYNRARAEKSYPPASTFKIPNALIGLKVGAVKDVDQKLPFTGDTKENPAWTGDMSLREAIKVSNLPIFQELARRIGLEKMKAELSRLDYGNNEVGQSVDNFWLGRPLAISAQEQCLFLARLAQKELPIPGEIQEAVKDISLMESGDDWRLYAKTGLAVLSADRLGWWVGWVEKEGRVYSFALNMDIQNFKKQGHLRLEVGRASLEALGVI